MDGWPATTMTFASLVLAAVTVILAVGGVFAFLSIQRLAREAAEAEARKIAYDVAEKAAVQYLQEEIPALMEQYRQLAEGAVTFEQGDRIADGEGRGA